MSVLIALLASTASQGPSENAPRERVAIGVTAPIVLLMPATLPAVRVSIPLGTQFGLDIDLGASVFWGDSSIGQVPDGAVFSGQLRWMRKGRQPDGNGRYWLAGPLHARGRDIGPDGEIRKDRAIRNVQIGYGWDRVRARTRYGAEISVGVASDGEARLFIVWGQQYKGTSHPAPRARRTPLPCLRQGYGGPPAPRPAPCAART
jgi:hypothetical protein